MSFSYTASVILLSLAIYGGWCLLRDMWQWYLEPRLVRPLGSTFLIFVHNQEEEIEELVRYFLQEMEMSEVECDAVVIDCASTDLTPAILERLATDHPLLHVVTLQDSSRPVGELLPLCRGSVIHILDMSNRLNSSEFLVTACALLRQSGRIPA